MKPTNITQNYISIDLTWISWEASLLLGLLWLLRGNSRNDWIKATKILNSSARRNASFLRQRSWIGHSRREHVSVKKKTPTEKNKKIHFTMIFLSFVWCCSITLASLCSNRALFAPLMKQQEKKRAAHQNKRIPVLDRTKRSFVDEQMAVTYRHRRASFVG